MQEVVDLLDEVDIFLAGECVVGEPLWIPFGNGVDGVLGICINGRIHHTDHFSIIDSLANGGEFHFVVGGMCVSARWSVCYFSVFHYDKSPGS